jgi:hypothetical protein
VADKTTAKKTTAKKKGTSSTGSRKKSTASSSGGERRSAPRAEPGRKPTGLMIAETASQQLAELTSKQVEAVTGLERTDDGWRVEVEVLELRRVPNTTDVLATYEVLVDTDGDVEGYRRRHRYVRGTPGDEAP